MIWPRRRLTISALVLGALVAACNAGHRDPAPSSATTSADSEAVLASEVPVDAVIVAVKDSATIEAVPADLTPPLELADADAQRLPTDHCAVVTTTFVNTVFGECVYGDVLASKKVVLFGDSHAGMWSTSLHLAGLRGGWSLRVFDQDGCPAPRITFFRSDVPETDCDQFREAAISEIVLSKPDAIVVTSATYFQRTGSNSNDFASAEQWRTGLEPVLIDLAASGARVIVLGDMPVLSQPAPECLAAHQQDIAQCRTPRAKALENVYHEAELGAATAAHATYVDPTDWFCTEICPPIVGRTLVYRNQFHISATYAAFLAGAVRSAIGPL
jgi:hypothetical protein